VICAHLRTDVSNRIMQRPKQSKKEKKKHALTDLPISGDVYFGVSVSGTASVSFFVDADLLPALGTVVVMLLVDANLFVAAVLAGS
jgi:hypothetical protein